MNKKIRFETNHINKKTSSGGKTSSRITLVCYDDEGCDLCFVMLRWRHK